MTEENNGEGDGYLFLCVSGVVRECFCGKSHSTLTTEDSGLQAHHGIYWLTRSSRRSLKGERILNATTRRLEVLPKLQRMWEGEYRCGPVVTPGAGRTEGNIGQL